MLIIPNSESWQGPPNLLIEAGSGGTQNEHAVK